MKKLFTTTVALLINLGISAQTEQGRMLIGADSEFSYTMDSEFGLRVDGEEPDGYEASDTKISNISAGMRFGYFIVNNLAVGAVLNYTSDKIDVDGDDPDPVNTTGYGAFARYYIGGVAFVGGSYAMQTSSTWDDLDDKPRVSTMAAEAGFSLFLSDNVAFTPSVSYGITSTKQEAYDFFAGKDIDVNQMTGRLKIMAGITIHL